MCHRILLYRNAVHLHHAFGGVIKSRDQLHQRRLGRAGLSDDAHGLARFYMEGNIRKHIFLRLFFILEPHMFKVHAAAFHFDVPDFFVRQIHLFVDNLQNSGAGRHRARQQQKYIGNHHQGIQNLQHIA